MAERSLGAPKVRGTHGREAHPLEGFRWKGDGNAQDDTEDPVFSEDLPEGLGFPQQPYDGLAQGNLEPADPQSFRVRLNLRGGKLSKVVLWIAMKEVKNRVLPWIHTCLERGPGNRAQRWHRRSRTRDRYRTAKRRREQDAVTSCPRTSGCDLFRSSAQPGHVRLSRSWSYR